MSENKTAWVRYRFKVEGDDYRPVKFPPPGPYWCTGSAGDGSYSTIVAYLPRGESVTEWWPEAGEDDATGAHDTLEFTDRFPCPKWWNGA
jgi:hypothetical protein